MALMVLMMLVALAVLRAPTAHGSMQEELIRIGNAFTCTEHDVRKAFRRVNTRKTAGPDGTSGWVLRTYTDQLAPVFMNIFNQSLAQSAILVCFK